MASTGERVAYVNGKIVPESQAVVSFRDRGFKYGDAVFDTARTFGGRVFRLREHVARLYRSLKYMRIDPGLSPAETERLTGEVLARNLPLLGPDEDYWLTQRVSRGVEPTGGELWQHTGPTVVIECTPLPLAARARLFQDGIDVAIPSVRRTPPDSLSPNAKTHNYLNLVIADLEVRSANPGAWAVLLDANGNLAEGLGSNIFVVEGGRLLTPKADYVLVGITRDTVFELAREAGIEVVETDVSPYRAYNAAEAFLTSTSLCICPVHRINGVAIGDGVPGPTTRRLMEAFVRLIDFDYVAQYLKHAS
jgi:branched-chain amino acid aminotransferase